MISVGSRIWNNTNAPNTVLLTSAHYDAAIRNSNIFCGHVQHFGWPLLESVTYELRKSTSLASVHFKYRCCQPTIILLDHSTLSQENEIKLIHTAFEMVISHIVVQNQFCDTHLHFDNYPIGFLSFACRCLYLVLFVLPAQHLYLNIISEQLFGRSSGC